MSLADLKAAYDFIEEELINLEEQRYIFGTKMNQEDDKKTKETVEILKARFLSLREEIVRAIYGKEEIR